MNELLQAFAMAQDAGVELSVSNTKLGIQIYGEKTGPHGTRRSLTRLVSYDVAEFCRVDYVAVEAKQMVEELAGV